MVFEIRSNPSGEMICARGVCVVVPSTNPLILCFAGPGVVGGVVGVGE